MVSTPAYITYVGILVLFVLPLVLAVIGGWIGALVEGDSAAHGMPVIVGGVLGVLACAPVAALVNRRLSRPRNAAVRKLSGAES
jgi:nitrate reductase gamma subunit